MMMTQAATFTARPATNTDLKYMMALQRDNRESVGGLDRRAERGAKHQPGIGPLVACAQALGFLLDAVLAEHRRHLRVQRDLAPRAVGFGWRDDQPPTDAGQRRGHPQQPGVEVDGRPRQPQRLTPA